MIDISSNLNPMTSAHPTESNTDPAPAIEIKSSEQRPANGHALVIHGLNMKPQKMSSISELMLSLGFDTWNISLKGHDGYFKDLQSVTRETWISEIENAYEQMKIHTFEYPSPKILVAYSLGAVMALDAMIENPEITFDKMILFAPAIRPRMSSTIFSIVKFIFGTRISIPSMSPQEFRVHSKTPLAAYDALFKSVRHLKKVKVATWEVPTLIFIDFQDELVSIPGLKKWIVKQNLHSLWKIQRISSSQAKQNQPKHHMITDPNLIGEIEWNKILDLVRDHLSEHLDASRSL